MPIHDQGYRRFGGRARARAARAWLVIATAGIRTMLRKRTFLGHPARSRGPRSSSAPCRSTFTTNFAQCRDPGADRADVPRVPRAAGHVRLLRHDLRRRRADRERPARQRAADLPVEAADAARVHRRQGGRAAGVPAVRDVGAGAAAAGRPDHARRQLRLRRARTCSCSRRSPSTRSCRSLLATFTMLALSSLSKSSRFVGIMYAGVMFFTDADLRDVLSPDAAPAARRSSRRRESLTQVGDVIFRLPPRYETPIAAVARWSSSALIGACRSSCSSAACAAWRWSRDRQTTRAHRRGRAVCASGTAR